MSKFDELVALRNQHLDQADSIIAKAETDGGTLTAEQATEIEELHGKAETLKAEIDAIQAAVEASNNLKEKQSALKNQRFNPIVNRIANDGGNVRPIDDGKFRLPANVRRFEPKNFKSDSLTNRSADEQAFRFGMWALATASRCMPAQYNFGRASQYCQQHGIYNVHGEGGSDVSNAGVFVPEDFVADIVRLVETYGVLRQIMRVVPMASETLVRPRRVGGLTAYAVGENQTVTESDTEWNNVRLLARKFGVATRMSSELSEDAVISFADQLLWEIAYAFAQKEDDCGFNGTGASTYNGIVGIRTQLATLTAGTAPGLINGAGSTWASLTLANFNSVVAALPQYAAMGSPTWICSRPFFYGVMVPLVQAANGTVVETLLDGTGTPRFLGYPVQISQAFPTATASGHIPVVLGDVNQAAMFGDRRALSVAFSTEATIGGQSIWERDQVGIRALERIDFVCHDFGTNSVAGPICGIKTQ